MKWKNTKNLSKNLFAVFVWWMPFLCCSPCNMQIFFRFNIAFYFALSLICWVRETYYLHKFVVDKKRKEAKMQNKIASGKNWNDVGRACSIFCSRNIVPRIQFSFSLALVIIGFHCAGKKIHIKIYLKKCILLF